MYSMSTSLPVWLAFPIGLFKGIVHQFWIYNIFLVSQQKKQYSSHHAKSNWARTPFVGFFSNKGFFPDEAGFFFPKKVVKLCERIRETVDLRNYPVLNVSWKLRTIQCSVVWIQATINTRFAVFKFMNKILESEAFSICKKRSKSCVNTLHKNSCKDSNE